MSGADGVRVGSRSQPSLPAIEVTEIGTDGTNRKLGRSERSFPLGRHRAPSVNDAVFHITSFGSVAANGSGHVGGFAAFGRTTGGDSVRAGLVHRAHRDLEIEPAELLPGPAADVVGGVPLGLRERRPAAVGGVGRIERARHAQVHDRRRGR